MSAGQPSREFHTRRHFLQSAAATLAGGLAVTATASGRDEGALPSFDGAVAWLNSAPITAKSLRGKVVLVNFWTYSCINSLRELPYIKAWAAKYKAAGLVVIGAHTPEFGFEKERANVERALQDHGVAYPVPMDSNYGIWQAFHNEYWPADYLIDAKGRIRYHHFGEGEYDKSERAIQELLRENGASGWDERPVPPSGMGIETAPGVDVQSPETYVGYERAEHFASTDRLSRDAKKEYSVPSALALNRWALSGSWTAGAESALAQAAGSKIVFRFHSRDLHLILGPVRNGTPVRFRAKLDGAPPGADSGLDIAADGSGEVREPRLYQLIRQKGRVEDRTVEIEFLDPGAQVYDFTFG